MAKVDAAIIRQAHDRLAAAKTAAFQAQKALEATQEFRIARDADKELELAEDLLAGIQMLLNGKVV